MTTMWTPVHSGPIYCSPACGGKCTWNAYMKAYVESEQLATELGPRWMNGCHENLGWHVCARHRTANVTICPTGPNQYTCYMGQWCAQGKTPREALHSAAQQAINTANDIFNMLKELA